MSTLEPFCFESRNPAVNRSNVMDGRNYTGEGAGSPRIGNSNNEHVVVGIGGRKIAAAIGVRKKE